MTCERGVQAKPVPDLYPCGNICPGKYVSGSVKTQTEMGEAKQRS